MSGLKETLDNVARGYADLLDKRRTGPKITVEALASNEGTIRVHPYDSPEIVLQPGETTSTFGYGLVVVAERARDGCHMTVG